MKKFVKRGCIMASIVIASLFTLGFEDSFFEVSKNLDIFATLYRELNIYYVDETDPGKLMKTGIDAMLKSLDPYTNYIPESQMEDYRFMTTGQYGGIGSLIRLKDEYVIIAEPYEGFPAHKAGLMAGDIILEVNGQSAKNKQTSELSKILKGEPKTSLTITVQREGTEEPIIATLIREEVKIDDVPYSGMISDNIGYIKLTSFTESASREVKAAYNSLKEQNELKGVVLDLRNNGGGLLREAVNIVNIFVEKGQDVVHTKGKVKNWDQVRKTLSEPEDAEIPLVVLINGGSASASEIVAGTFQDLDRGVLVGERSFGKGLVQQTRSLSYNSKLKVTVAKYYIPSGRCIQKIDYSHRDEKGKAGVVPDSLIAQFQTNNGREVFDGNGVDPDIKVETPYMSDVAQSLLSKNLIFDYATKFRLVNDSIAGPETFDISDKEYDLFKEYLKDKDYDYKTETEEVLTTLKEASMKDKYFNSIQTEYDILLSKIETNKKDDISNFKSEISYIMENEIVSRYYFQKGRLIASLYTDEEVKKAIEVLENKEMYSAILAGTYDPIDKSEKVQKD